MKIPKTSKTAGVLKYIKTNEVKKKRTLFNKIIQYIEINILHA